MPHGGSAVAVIGGPMDTSQRDALRGALEALTHDGSVASAVPIDIGDSWRRSLDSGLAPDRFDVPRSDSFESDSPLARAARPILKTLGAELANAGLSMILADDHGQVVDRHVTDKALDVGIGRDPACARLRLLGTRRRDEWHRNRARTAHADVRARCRALFRRPHYVGMCGSADHRSLHRPRARRHRLHLPRMRRESPHASPGTTAAAEIGQHLVSNSGPMERAALRTFLQQRGEATALAFVSQGRVIANANADEFISSADEPTLWFVAAQTLERRQPQTTAVTLSSGRSIRLRCEPVADGNTLIGALVRIGAVGEGGRASRPKDSPTFGWDSLTATERSVVSLASRGMTNRQIANELVMSHRTVSSHLYHVFPKLGVTSRVELVRFALERGLISP